jgi:cell division protease FtsH
MEQREPRQREEPAEFRPTAPAASPGRRLPVLWLILGALILGWLWTATAREPAGQPVPYSDFVAEVERGNVERITSSGDEITGAFVDPVTVGEADDVERFVTYVPGYGDEALAGTLRAHDVVVAAEPVDDTPWALILVNLIPILLIVAIAVFFIRRMRAQGQGLFSITQSRAKPYHREQTRTTFDDVAGNTNSKRELLEIVEFLREPERFRALGGQIPRGVLLVGPPGTGKTLLARAVAGEASVPFYSITGSDFMEMLVGVGASRVRNLFKDARRDQPSIIFIDELDAIGRRRGAGLGGGHDEREQTLNQLLSELDGFEPRETVIVMAATNRPDVLDPALLRPGRFDRQVTMDLPTLRDREQILAIHARTRPLATDVDLQVVARHTTGFSGAELANLLNEASILAVRRNRAAIAMADIEAAREKLLMGVEREGIELDERDREILAYHEGGHAALAALLPHADPLHKVTIIPRGHAIGMTQQIPVRDRHLMSRDVPLDRLAVMLGGRAAEAMLGTATTGAEADLKQATRLARKMVVDWGMSERIGPVAFGEERAQPFLGEELTHHRDHSERTARDIDEEVTRVLREAYERGRAILEEKREPLAKLVRELLAEETVDAARLKEIFGLAPEPAS